jgi:hypothetical protein
VSFFALLACLAVPYEGGPRGLCVRQAFTANLEEDGVTNVVLVVEAPHRFDSQIRKRLFIYRLDGRKLVPRFLGSRLGALELESARAERGGLEVRASGRRFQCHFEQFPLVCEER